MAVDMDALERVVTKLVEPNAEDVDRSGAFPTESVKGLREAGLLGLTDLADAAAVIERVSAACGSTAMVTLMHYAGAALLQAHGPDAVKTDLAAGRHLTTLAFSEAGSRSHFWAPESTAVREGGQVRLDARKSWVTSGAQADSFVWSSRPLAADGPMTLWLVPSDAAGLDRSATFDGLGLRGNGSIPVSADGVLIDSDRQLGDDGAGLDIALAVALPWFLVLSTAFTVGLMESVTAETSDRLRTTRLQHLGIALIEQPVTRIDFARMRVTTDSVRAFLADALAALGAGRPDAVLRVLESKALGAEAMIAETDLAMKLCGGAAFRKELGIERRFRDARAARVMAPTTDALLDFVGRAVNDLPLLDA